MTPTYLLDKIARHGAAVQRLCKELETSDGELGVLGEQTALAFDAADFIWACAALRGDEVAQSSRELRNDLAEAILQVLRKHSVLPDLDKGKL